MLSVARSLHISNRYSSIPGCEAFLGNAARVAALRRGSTRQDSARRIFLPGRTSRICFVANPRARAEGLPFDPGTVAFWHHPNQDAFIKPIRTGNAMSSCRPARPRRQIWQCHPIVTYCFRVYIGRWDGEYMTHELFVQSGDKDMLACVNLATPGKTLWRLVHNVGSQIVGKVLLKCVRW